MPTITGSSGDDTLTGTDEDDIIRGGDGNDVINSLLGADQMYGEGGDDTFVFTTQRPYSLTLPLGRIDGGEGFDTLDLRGISEVWVIRDDHRLQITSQYYQLSGIEQILMGDRGYGVVLTNQTTGFTVRGGAGNDQMRGGSGIDRFYGAGGNDVLTGGSGDFLYGEDGADTLVGGRASLLSGGVGNDDLTFEESSTVDGGDGDDVFHIVPSTYVYTQGNPGRPAGTINGGAGVDTVFAAGGGNVSIGLMPGNSGFGATQSFYSGSTIAFVATSYSLTSIENVTLDVAAASTASVVGSDEANVLRLTAGFSPDGPLLTSAVLDGRGGNDTLIGGAYATRLLGGDGDDVMSGSATAYYDGGAGVDTVSFAALTTGVTVSLRDETITTVRDGVLETRRAFLSIENVTGTGQDDTVTNSNANNIIDGGAGLDTVVFASRWDQVTLTYEDGAVVVTGPEGRDVLRNVERLRFADGLSSIGPDGRFSAPGLTFIGTAGNDTLTGTDGDDTILGGDGNDIIDGRLGADRLFGEGGDDLFVFSAIQLSNQPFALGLFDGGAGFDTIDLRAVTPIAFVTSRTTPEAFRMTLGTQVFDVVGIERILTGDRRDILDFRDYTLDLTLELGGGDDIVQGGARSILNGGAGNDTLTGGLELHGGDGDDILTGGIRQFGGAGNDDMRGSALTQMDGGDGDDVFRIGYSLGANGTGSVVGGAGHNALFIALQTPFRGGITSFSVDLELGMFTTSNTTRDSTGTLFYTARTAISGIQDVQMEQGSLFGNGEANILRGAVEIDGRGGDDWIVGSAADNILRGGAGDDLIETGTGLDTVDGGEGNDTVSYAGLPVGITVSLAAGTASVAPQGFLELKDRLTGIENVVGSGFADFITGDAGANRLDGGAGNDSLSGGDGDDFLIGGSGDDTIDGGAGSDTAVFTGVRSAYQFSVDNGVVTVTGPDGRDVLRNVEFLQFSDSRLAVTPNGVQLLGGAGDDLFTWTSSSPFSSVDGGAGRDTLDFRGYVNSGGPQEVSFSRIVVGAASDTLQGERIASTPSGPRPPSTLFSAVNIERLVVGQTTVDLTGYVRDIEVETVSGLAVTTGAGNDRLIGSQNNDTLNGGAGTNFLYGGGGMDLAVFSYASSAASFMIESGLLVVVGAQSRDYLTSIETLQFTDLTISVSGVRVGTGGADALAGDAGVDFLWGGAGDDVLTGGAGDDILDGGAGRDIAVFGVASTAVTFTYENGAIVVTGTEGRDVLRGVETLRFSDRILDVGSDGRVVTTLNTVTGTAGPDVLVGTAGSDAIAGGAGDDVLTGRDGSDILNGGDGIDLATYSGVRRQYQVSSTQVSGGIETGIDTLMSIEGARFVDGTLTFDANSQAAQLMRLYDAALDRVADPGGFDGLLDRLERGETLLSLAQSFLASPEFQQRYGGLTNQQFIEQMYRFCLDREGDPQGIADWTARLNAGTSRGEMLVIFSESQEHRGLTAGTLNQGLWVADDEALQIARLYDASFNRLPDVGGLRTWVERLDGGMSLLDIASAFAGSAEFQQSFGTLTNRQFVEKMYLQSLDRLGDPLGIQGWVNALDSGMSRGQLLLIFSESAEHIALTAPLWWGGVQTQPYVSGAPTENGYVKGLDDVQILPGLVDGLSDDGFLHHGGPLALMLDDRSLDLAQGNGPDWSDGFHDLIPAVRSDPFVPNEGTAAETPIAILDDTPFDPAHDWIH
ncbi:DUF4214 domain-containing protein [Brevundimonas sp. NIBR11]|uniref:DUF4214 domain-containing protein n=1 Tax=Brevundimonas sp. NIBR11 TaxID=3015999 RepID=UPI0022F135BD|nr:DUF4214 domain-containing protein [Brevundimonas sp. NIBR11]WGM32720.1 hypothetical protein KKHFBJBL_02974 [Brevundimonas sp. NIBR11]